MLFPFYIFFLLNITLSFLQQTNNPKRNSQLPKRYFSESTRIRRQKVEYLKKKKAIKTFSIYKKKSFLENFLKIFGVGVRTDFVMSRLYFLTWNILVYEISRERFLKWKKTKKKERRSKIAFYPFLPPFKIWKKKALIFLIAHNSVIYPGKPFSLKLE